MATNAWANVLRSNNSNHRNRRLAGLPDPRPWPAQTPPGLPVPEYGKSK